LEVGKEWRHDLVVVAAVALLAKGLMFEGMTPGGVTAFLMGVEFVKFMEREWGDVKERLEEDFRVFVVDREDGIDREWGEQDVNDGQCERCVTRSGSKAMDDGGVELVHVREVEVKAAMMFEPFGTQGTLVEATRGVEDENVVLEVSVAGSGEDTMWAVERWQERRHILVGERRCV